MMHYSSLQNLVCFAHRKVCQFFFDSLTQLTKPCQCSSLKSETV
jgi:hypothetical protein